MLVTTSSPAYSLFPPLPFGLPTTPHAVAAPTPDAASRVPPAPLALPTPPLHGSHAARADSTAPRPAFAASHALEDVTVLTDGAQRVSFTLPSTM